MSPETMTSMQRVLTALGQQEPDRVPLFLLTTMHGARELGLGLQDYFSRADQVVEGQLRLREKYQGDCLFPFHCAAAETEAWGGTICYVDDGPANAGPPILDAAGIPGLRPPELERGPTLLRTLETIAGLKAAVADSVPIIGVVMSPFSLPVLQMGFAAYLDLMHRQPDLLEQLLRVNEEFAVAWANAQLAAGATAICYFDPLASPTMVPRALYLKTGHPAARRTIARIQGPTATHLASGRTLEVMDDLAATGTLIVGPSSMEDMAEVKRAAAGRVSLLGNLNGIEMRRWSAQDAEDRVKAVIAQAGRGGGLLLGDNHGEIPWQVPDDVLLAIAAAARHWGRYPLDWLDAGPGAH